MKPSFSFNDALTAPFAMLRRRPLYLFVWGLLMAAMMAAIYSVMIPLLAGISFGDTDSVAAMEEYAQRISGFGAAINGLNLLMYLLMLVLWTAAGRSALSPARGDRFLFLRVGMDEVRVAVVIIAVFVGWYVAFLVLVLLGVGIGFALWPTGRTTAVAALMIYGLIVFGVSVWALVRVSLIAPATLILRRFAFAEGWALARGQVWKLIGLNLVVWVIHILIAVLMYAAVGAVLAAGFFGQGLVWPTDVESIADLEPLLQPMTIPALLAILPFSIGYGLNMTCYAAPGVVAARQLLDGAPVSRPIAEDAPPADTLQSL